MSDIQFLSKELQHKSRSTEEIILSYFDAIVALDELKEAGLAILGFELIFYREAHTIEHNHFIVYFPDEIVWDEFIETAYQQVKDQINKEYLHMQYSDLNEDDFFFVITVTNKEEFESYYYKFIRLD